jgi:hypothetical protein
MNWKKEKKKNKPEANHHLLRSPCSLLFLDSTPGTFAPPRRALSPSLCRSNL